MLANRLQAAVGCLLIEGTKPGMSDLSGLRLILNGYGILSETFRLTGGPDLHGRLQEAYYEIRRRCAVPTIVAGRQACWAALALAEQLPADRLVLIDPGEASPGIGIDAPIALRRSLSRLKRFAVNNLSFCTGDVLAIVGQPEAVPRLRRRMRAAKGRLACVQIAGNAPGGMTGAAADGVASFLVSGELPKSLAENAEMCIIYG